MNNYFANLSSQALSRATESTLSILGITDPALRAHLGDIMSRDPGNAGSFLAPPVFEQMFGWETTPQTMNDLATDGSMLSREVVNSLDNAANGRYRFGADWQPFTHQLASWRSLLEKKHSVIVTSGTGSGNAPAVALAPPDMLISLGTGSTFQLIDVSNAIAGQTASNISVVASGNISSTDGNANSTNSNGPSTDNNSSGTNNYISS